MLFGLQFPRANTLRRKLLPTAGVDKLEDKMWHAWHVVDIVVRDSCRKEKHAVRPWWCDGDAVGQRGRIRPLTTVAASPSHPEPQPPQPTLSPTLVAAPTPTIVPALVLAPASVPSSRLH